MRVAQCTDVHWTVAPSPWHVPFSKRLLGTINLYGFGRARRFDPRAQAALPLAMAAAKPDVVLVTGDLTAQAIPAEFEAARVALEPLLAGFPTLVLRGNHDVYTVGAQRSHRIERYFGPWMGLQRHPPLARLDAGDLTVLGLDPCRAWFDATGVLPQDQLDALAERLADPELDGRALILALHYPILGADGQPYKKRDHRLINADQLVAVLERARRRPDLIVHGHEHHGFTADLVFGDGARVPIHDPGTGGYKRDPAHHRAAAFNVYTIEPGRLVGVERFVWDGERFAAEEPGVYRSGY